MVMSLADWGSFHSVSDEESAASSMDVGGQEEEEAASSMDVGEEIANDGQEPSPRPAARKSRPAARKSRTPSPPRRRRCWRR